MSKKARPKRESKKTPEPEEKPVREEVVARVVADMRKTLETKQ